MCCTSCHHCWPFRGLVHSEGWHFPDPVFSDVSHMVQNGLLKTWNIHHRQTKKKGLSFFILSLKQLSAMFVNYCGSWMCHRPHLSTTGRWFHSLYPTMVHQIPNILCCMCQILGFEWSAPCVEGVVDGTELNNASWGILPKWFYAG